MSDIDLNALAAPIAKQYVKSREVGGGRKAAYITARTAMNRLDEVCGRENWRTEYRLIQSGKETGIECTLYIRINGEWVGKADVGDPSNIDPLKGAYSDALKRAAAQWGVARELYGDGNAYETDDEPERATTAAPESPKSALDEHLGRKVAWLTAPVLRTLVAEAEKYWRDHDNATSDRAHTINRLAQEWGVGLVTGDQDALFAETQAKKPAEWTKEDAWAAVTGYTPKTKPAKNAGKRAAAASGPAAGQ